MAIKYTDRGFGTYADFKDSYGASVVIRESSSAEQDAVWLFVRGGGVENNDGAAHLTTKQASVVITALQEWLVFINKERDD